MSAPPRFTTHDLGTGHVIYTGRIPDSLIPAPDLFETLWNLHPAGHPVVSLVGRQRTARRWYQAFGEDYSFAGSTSLAEPVHELFQPYLDWTRSAVDVRINGLLVNWYDGGSEHRIAQHKDAPDRRIDGCPIVTISLGDSRTFLMHVSKRELPFVVGMRDVIVIPDTTNDRHAHSVPLRTGNSGRRISVTLREFSSDAALHKPPRTG